MLNDRKYVLCCWNAATVFKGQINTLAWWNLAKYSLRSSKICTALELAFGR
jgi:hypothetical protein